MALEINGAGLLSAMAKNPQAFGMTVTQLNALALTAVLGRLKDRATDVGAMCSIAGAIDRLELRLVLDSLSARDLGSIVKRLDPKHPEIKSADENWIRDHIVRLAYKDEMPTAAAVKVVKPRAPKAPKEPVIAKTGEVMKSKALKARPLIGTGKKPSESSPAKARSKKSVE